jgi:hypothetical protein
LIGQEHGNTNQKLQDSFMLHISYRLLPSFHFFFLLYYAEYRKRNQGEVMKARKNHVQGWGRGLGKCSVRGWD